MSDAHMRTMFKPVDHFLRDWMHTLVSGGVANIEVAGVLHVLASHGISYGTVGTFIECYRLPHRLGTTSATWVSQKRLGPRSQALKSFSGVMLTIIPIIAAFLVDTIAPTHELYEYAQCFWMLNCIVGILSFGPDGAMPYIDQLRTLIARHAALYARLYPNTVKPKFHHLRN
jgi:hypothetical protein